MLSLKKYLILVSGLIGLQYDCLSIDLIALEKELSRNPDILETLSINGQGINGSITSTRVDSLNNVNSDFRVRMRIENSEGWDLGEFYIRCENEVYQAAKQRSSAPGSDEVDKATLVLEFSEISREDAISISDYFKVALNEREHPGHSISVDIESDEDYSVSGECIVQLVLKNESDSPLRINVFPDFEDPHEWFYLNCRAGRFYSEIAPGFGLGKAGKGLTKTIAGHDVLKIPIALSKKYRFHKIGKHYCVGFVLIEIRTKSKTMWNEYIGSNFVLNLVE
jgi:hypothetical protein